LLAVAIVPTPVEAPHAILEPPPAIAEAFVHPRRSALGHLLLL
jgi:hypothetical protein